jgi:hypothetical protein
MIPTGLTLLTERPISSARQPEFFPDGDRLKGPEFFPAATG